MFEVITMFNKETFPGEEAYIEPFSSITTNQYISWSDHFGLHMKKHWVDHWICTDTQVGLACYLLDGEMVAISTQQGRKCPEEIKFINEEAYIKVRDLVTECYKIENDSESYIPLVDMNEKLDPYYYTFNRKKRQ